MSEARTGKRFPLELPIKIHKEEGGGDHTEGRQSSEQPDGDHRRDAHASLALLAKPVASTTERARLATVGPQEA